MTRKGYSRAVRKVQIINAIYEIGGLYGKLSVTTADVATHLHMTPSPHLRSMLQELVQEKRLEVATIMHRPNVTKYAFSLPLDDAFGEVELKSEPVIKIKGRKV